LDEGVEKEVALPVDSELEKNLKSGDWVTFHWGFVCDKVSSEQVRNLKFYTKHNLRLANETI
jgi:hydrogenase maturation factor